MPEEQVVSCKSLRNYVHFNIQQVYDSANRKTFASQRGIFGFLSDFQLPHNL